MSSPVRRDARRYRRRILTIGVVLFGVLFVVMAPNYVDSVERDLEVRVPDELAAAGYDHVTALFDGQDGTLSCEQPLADPEAARQAAYDVWGVRAIALDRTCRVNTSEAETASTTVPASEPAGPDDTDDTVRAGTARTTITAAATTSSYPSVADAVSSAPQLSLLDVLAREAGFAAELADPSADPLTLFAPSDDAFEELPADFLADLRSDADTLRQLLVHHTAPGTLFAADLENGPLEMTDDATVAVDADEPSIGGATIIEGDLDAANGVVHIIDAVLIPDALDPAQSQAPTALDVTYGSEAVTLTGTAATEAVRATLERASGATGVSVVNELEVDPETGLDQAAADNLVVLVDAVLAHLSTGNAGFEGERFYLRGTYLTDADRDAAAAAAASVGVEPMLDPAPDAPDEGDEGDEGDDAADLERELNDYVAANPIRFEPSSAVISDDSAAIVDRIAELAGQFDGVAITVQGHTDSDGSDTNNLALSQVRASAVRDALVERGLDPDSLAFEGFGSQQLVVVDGVENKAASRRVEFVVETVP